MRPLRPSVELAIEQALEEFEAYSEAYEPIELFIGSGCALFEARDQNAEGIWSPIWSPRIRVYGLTDEETAA